MNPEDEGPRDGRMEQVFVDGTLEAGNHNRRQQQRHREIEVATQNPVATGEGRRAQFFLRADCSPDAFYVYSGHSKNEQGLQSFSPGPREHTRRVPGWPSFSDSSHACAFCRVPHSCAFFAQGWDSRDSDSACSAATEVMERPTFSHRT